jgi:hypothetical protein
MPMYSTCFGRTGPACPSFTISAKPMMELSGVRNSWPKLARNCDFAKFAVSAARSADSVALWAASTAGAAGSSPPRICAFPGDVAHGFGQSVKPGYEGLADPGGITVGPGGFDQDPTSAAIAGQDEPLAAYRLAGRASAGTRPTKDISWRGLSKRRTSPISAVKVTATMNETPRIAW